MARKSISRPAWASAVSRKTARTASACYSMPTAPCIRPSATVATVSALATNTAEHHSARRSSGAPRRLAALAFALACRLPLGESRRLGLLTLIPGLTAIAGPRRQTAVLGKQRLARPLGRRRVLAPRALVATTQRRLLCRNQLMLAGANQISAPHGLERLAQQGPVVGIVIAQEGLVQTALPDRKSTRL